MMLFTDVTDIKIAERYLDSAKAWGGKKVL